MSDHANEAAAAAALKARLDAEMSAIITASTELTTFRYQQPTPAEQAIQQRAQAAAADKNARAVLLQPANSDLLGQLKLCGQHCALGPLKFLEVVKALVPIVLEYGLAAFDGDKDVSLELSNAAAKALHNYHDNIEVALVAGSLFEALSDHNMLKDIPLAMESCKSALILHGVDKRVQRLYGSVMMGYGYLHLDQQDHVVLRKELEKARIFMTPLSVEEGQQAVPITPQEVLQCLTRVTEHACFQIMCYGEQVEYKIQVAEFAVWCLTGSVHQVHDASFFGDRYVGRQACALLYQMATCSLQRDREYLVEEDLRWLCSLDLHQLLFEVRLQLQILDGTHDDAHIEWLFVRLQRTPLYQAMSGKRPAPVEASVAAPAAKRGRGEGGSA